MRSARQKQREEFLGRTVIPWYPGSAGGWSQGSPAETKVCRRSSPSRTMAQYSQPLYGRVRICGYEADCILKGEGRVSPALGKSPGLHPGLPTCEGVEGWKSTFYVAFGSLLLPDHLRSLHLKPPWATCVQTHSSPP